jgi:hypothetical protein
MITYVLSHVSRILREAISPLLDTPSVSRTRTHFLVRVNGTLHRVRRDHVDEYIECDCGGTPQSPCHALPLVQDYPSAGSGQALAAGGPRPLGHHESTWPEAWTTIPSLCPICDCPTVADRYLDSSHGPGWRCTFDASHYWWVRLNPLRRALAAHRQTPRYPWYDTLETEQKAWLEAHSHPLRCVPNSNPLEVMP